MQRIGSNQAFLGYLKMKRIADFAQTSVDNTRLVSASIGMCQNDVGQAQKYYIYNDYVDTFSLPLPVTL